MTRPAIATFDLTKDYSTGFFRKRPKRALDRLSLEVGEGEVFGLLGPNGAGKSTALKLLLRLIFPTAGRATVLGRELDDVSMHARIGYLPEHPYFYDHLSAHEFLNYAGELCGLDKVTRRRRIGDLLERVGLAGSEDIPLRKFSKGMLQRVGIAQALVNDPEVLFLDEPMSGLDPLGRREIRDLILELKGKGKTIFFSTHILPDAEMLCDRVAILNRGELQGCGELRDILSLDVSATEIVLEHSPADLLAKLQPFTSRAVRTGDSVRLEIPTGTELTQVLETVLRAGCKITSLNPVKMSLEDYFLSRVSEGAGRASRGRNIDIRLEGKR